MGSVDWDKAITHILAVFFSVACFVLVGFALVALRDREFFQAVGQFASGILGFILGFYFNRERLVKETEEKERYSA